MLRWRAVVSVQPISFIQFAASLIGIAAAAAGYAGRQIANPFLTSLLPCRVPVLHGAFAHLLIADDTSANALRGRFCANHGTWAFIALMSADAGRRPINKSRVDPINGQKKLKAFALTQTVGAPVCEAACFSARPSVVGPIFRRTGDDGFQEAHVPHRHSAVFGRAGASGALGFPSREAMHC